MTLLYPNLLYMVCYKWTAMYSLENRVDPDQLASEESAERE